MSSIQIVCVNRDPGTDSYAGLNYYEGVNTENHAQRLWWDRDGIVVAVDQHLYDFWTWANGKWAKIRSVHPQTGRPWVQTDADRFTGNNLLDLPPCPMI